MRSARWVNHSAASVPAVKCRGRLFGVGSGNSVITPLTVMRPILLPASSANHSAPSGPAKIPLASEQLRVGTGNSVVLPLGVMRAIMFTAFGANRASIVDHRLPSGPIVIPRGLRTEAGFVAGY